MSEKVLLLLASILRVPCRAHARSHARFFSVVLGPTYVTSENGDIELESKRQVQQYRQNL